MRHKHPKEGKMTMEVEKRTSKIPSGVYLAMGITAMAASLTLQCIKKKKLSLFIGQWVSPLLIMGLYNKMVKTVGHDKR